MLQQNQIFVTDFAKTISLLPGSAATHMPTSIYNYMNTNFFQYLCDDPDVGDNKRDLTSEAIPLKNCQCEGLNFFGMPDIEFLLSVDQYNTNYVYKLSP